MDRRYPWEQEQEQEQQPEQRSRVPLQHQQTTEATCHSKKEVDL
jgi:hypothetical protein